MGQLATSSRIRLPMRLKPGSRPGNLPISMAIQRFIEPDPVMAGCALHETSRKCKAAWKHLSSRATLRVTLSVWASHPAERSRQRDHECVWRVRFDSGERKRPFQRCDSSPEKGASCALSVFPNELTEAPSSPSSPTRPRSIRRKTNGLVLCQGLSDNASVHTVATALMETEPWIYRRLLRWHRPFFPRLLAYHPPTGVD